MIAMIGNPFSPAYARARARDANADPVSFTALNVAIRKRNASRWCLVERSSRFISRETSALAIGPSSVRWDGGGLTIDLRERSTPWGAPIRGRITLRPSFTQSHVLNLEGSHVWQPIAPHGRVEVSLGDPDLHFQGTGYLDRNAGPSPLETAFTSWSWARISDAERVRVVYDVVTRAGEEREHGLELDRDGIGDFYGGDRTAMSPTMFGLSRSVRLARGERLAGAKTLESGPFYARTAIDVAHGRDRAHGVHESLSLDRLVAPWVQRLIPFRARRAS